MISFLAYIYKKKNSICVSVCQRRVKKPYIAFILMYKLQVLRDCWGAAGWPLWGKVGTFSQKLSIIALLVKMVVSDNVDCFALLKIQDSYNLNLSYFLKELLPGKVYTYRLFFPLAFNFHQALQNFIPFEYLSSPTDWWGLVQTLKHTIACSTCCYHYHITTKIAFIKQTNDFIHIFKYSYACSLII